MKKYILMLSVAMLVIAGCKKDFLNRVPESSISPQQFFNTESDLIIYTNSFYNALPGTAVYADDNESDNIEPSSISLLMSGKLTVPSSASDAGWTWSTLRNINFFLENYYRANISEDKKANYAGLAKFFRAYFYFNKLQRFGDVPWYSKSLNVDDPSLYKGRDTRTLVTDSIVADLDYAIQYLGTTVNTSRVNKYTALALKSRVCLFEGTYRKYHTELSLTGSAPALLKSAYESAEAIMNAKAYKLYSTGNPDKDYQALFAAESAIKDEIILAEVYDATLNKTHPTNGIYTSPTLGNPGLTKSLINSFLMKDGTSFTNKAGYDQLMFKDEIQDRDPRLKQLIRTPGYTRTGTTTVLIPDFSNTLTGYQGIKYVTTTAQDGWNTNTNDLPVFRYAEVLLNYAEAKAELGVFSQADVEKSINLLRTRAGVGLMNLSTIVPDAYQQNLYKNVNSAIILEIRRERRVELALEGFRYKDLLRWKQGHLLAETFLGMYFPNKGTFDLDGDGKLDFAIVDQKPASPVTGIQYYVLGTDRSLSNGNSGFVIAHPTTKKVFDETKNYLYPLPTTEITLNPKLIQNPNWK